VAVFIQICCCGYCRFACDAATAWLSPPFPAIVLLTPLLLLVVVSITVAGCRLLSCSHSIISNAAVTTCFCCHLCCCCTALAAVATCHSCCSHFCCRFFLVCELPLLQLHCLALSSSSLSLSLLLAIDPDIIEYLPCMILGPYYDGTDPILPMIIPRANCMSPSTCVYIWYDWYVPSRGINTKYRKRLYFS